MYRVSGLLQSADWRVRRRAKYVLSFTDPSSVSLAILTLHLMLEMWWYLQKRSACKTNSEKFCLTTQYETGKGTVSLALAAISQRGPCHGIEALLTGVQDEMGPPKKGYIGILHYGAVSRASHVIDFHYSLMHVARREVRVEQGWQVTGWSHPRGPGYGQCCSGERAGQVHPNAVLAKWRQAKNPKSEFFGGSPALFPASPAAGAMRVNTVPEETPRG